MPNSSGKLQYLTIVGYKDNAFGTKVGSYRALINPDKYTQNFHVEYNFEQGLGTPNSSIKFKYSPPSDISFELLFDGTGVISQSRTDVQTEIENFKKIVYDYNGEIHSPNYLKLIWGSGLSFQCRLTSLSFNYTLFRSDGTPLRAKGNVSFKNYVSPKQVKTDSDNQSPDMTHERTVRAGDTLPTLTKEIYGDNSHYLKVAAYNKLSNFRYLVPGSVIYFPPLV